MKGEILRWISYSSEPVKFTGRVFKFPSVVFKKRHSWKGKTKMGDWVVVMVAKLCEYTKATELHTLKGRILGYEIYQQSCYLKIRREGL